MYNLYKEKCEDDGLEPVKLSMYRHIFVTEYNLDFHIRKSDRCDICEEFKMAESQNTLNEELREKYAPEIEGDNTNHDEFVDEPDELVDDGGDNQEMPARREMSIQEEPINMNLVRNYPTRLVHLNQLPKGGNLSHLGAT
ncbi:hypothetical protein J6590_100091 [Homalodisca vitripennis]|nr:hypothetical protein J6590_100091 [Homalodisca vitripennis]